MISLFSPAKLNLSFRVLRRREDGYHEIASLFQAISLGDLLHVTSAAEDLLTCSDPTLPCDGSNLVLKAASLFRRKTGIAAYAKFHLDKAIPTQAGLGGGSSNAATALWALNTLFNRPATVEELCLWSQEIGSDVPFFFSQGTAYCTGRGEILRSLPPLASKTLWIAKPSYGLSTPLVYKQCKPVLRENSEIYFNDLEESAFTLLPELATLKKQLLSLGFTTVVMTGSGTAFFCLGQTQTSPVLPGVQFFAVDFISRERENWYRKGR